MKIAPECAACLYLQLMKTLDHRGVTDQTPVQRAVMLSLADQWSDYDSPAQAIDQMYQVANHATNQADAYTDEKVRANALAEIFWRQHPLPLEDLAGRMAYAASANIIDAGLDANPEHLFSQLHEAMDEGLGINTSSQFFADVPEGSRLLYVTDNAGEVVFDRELIRALRHQGYSVTILVRHHPFLNDVTREDVCQVHLDTVADRVLDLGDGFAIWTLSPEMLETWGQEFDGFIIKGIANLEALSHRTLPHPALFLYRAKCPPSARLAGAEWNQNVAWRQPS